MNVKNQFDNIAKLYDSQRTKLIPCFNDFYDIATDSLGMLADDARIIDLGAGTGLFSQKVLERFPKCSVSLSDISLEMLEIAKKRFEGMKNVDFNISDFCDIDNFALSNADSFAAVISALAIHHIKDSQKIALYANIYKMLKPKGVFVNAEQVLGDCAVEIERNSLARKLIVQKYMSPDDAKTALTRLKLDKCATLSVQLQWLREIGFSYVYCPYKYLDFAVIVAVKD